MSNVPFRFILLRINKPPAKNAIPPINDPIIEPIKIPLVTAAVVVSVVITSAADVIVVWQLPLAVSGGVVFFSGSSP